MVNLAKRSGPLEACSAKEAEGCTLAALPFQNVLCFRVRDDLADAFFADLGFQQTPAHLTLIEGEAGHLCKIGPDEYWLLNASEGVQQQAVTIRDGRFIAIVDLSHRTGGIEIKGDGAADLIACVCPLDLREQSLPPLRATRTVFGKIEVLLTKYSQNHYELRANLSLQPYLFELASRCLLDRPVA